VRGQTKTSVVLNAVKELRTHRNRVLASLTTTVLFLFASSLISADSPDILEVAKFSMAPEGAALPNDWRPLTFPGIRRHTTYQLVREDGVTAVKAMSEASASGLIRELQVNLRDYPVVSWRWKVMNILHKGDVTKKEGDDYPARLYIMFGSDDAQAGFLDKARFEAYRLIYGRYPPAFAITYIWDSRAAKGTMVPNPFTGRARMVVVESGPALVGQWIAEERNLYEDYKKAFGREAPLVSGIAIMTDTDNTGESAVAYYGDIEFKKPVSHMP
jgi:hypothetical protein